MQSKHLKHWACFFVLLVSILLTIACSSPPLTTVVKVNEGTIEGVQQDGIFSYKGIPFAAPPVGDLRWKTPQPADTWTGVKSADTYACGCMQDSSMAAMTGAPANSDEDCLYLNIWTGAKNVDEKRPVIEREIAGPVTATCAPGRNAGSALIDA